MSNWNSHFSVVYITLNAARLLRESLESVRTLTDDLVIVDAGSTDETLNIAESFRARIFQRPWPGFGLQKQFAVEQARHDWVLILDADEVLVPGSIPLLKQALSTPALPAGFLLPRHNYLHGKRIRYGDWSRDRVLRLVDRRQGQFSPDQVHERWLTDGTVRLLDAPLAHYSFPDYKSMLAKLDQYSDLNARQLLARGARISAGAPMSHALAAFVKGYIFRLGFLDGTEGAAIALTTALGSFMKYAKALELQQAQGENP